MHHMFYLWTIARMNVAPNLYPARPAAQLQAASASYFSQLLQHSNNIRFIRSVDGEKNIMTF